MHDFWWVPYLIIRVNIGKVPLFIWISGISFTWSCRISQVSLTWSDRISDIMFINWLEGDILHVPHFMTGDTWSIHHLIRQDIFPVPLSIGMLFRMPLFWYGRISGVLLTWSEIFVLVMIWYPMLSSMAFISNCVFCQMIVLTPQHILVVS